MPDVDFGRRSDDYARYRPGFPKRFYDRLKTFIYLPGIHAVDLGTGPGIIAVELAARGAQVTGIDIASNQVRVASEVALRKEVADRCTFIVASADDTGLENASVHLVTAGQCWDWFDEVATLREVQRILAPDGLLVVAQYCYLPQWSDVAKRTEDLILQHNPDWTMGGFDGTYAHRIDALQQTGMSLVDQFCWDHDQEFSHAEWRGRIRTCNGVGSGHFSDEQVEDFDRQLNDMLERDYPHEPLTIRHRVWMVVCRNVQRGGRRD